jgi:putative peptidoglycan lipid II flippase
MFNVASIFAAFENAVVLLWLLRGRLHGIEGRRITAAFVKISCASLLMGAAAHLASRGLALLPPGGEAGKLVQVFGAIGLALVVLALSARLLRIEEFEEATGRFLRRFRR